jgi:5'(3')-deoxyribonucleotidase
MTKNTFYLDMDGVVADWEAAASTFLRRPMRNPDSLTHYRNTPEEWDKIKTQSRFYRTLPLMPRVDELVHLARQYRDTLGWELLFLTAVPAKDDVHWAFYDKVMWAQDHFPDIPVHFGPHSYEKRNHCTSGDILVDDRPDNCAQWVEAGGTAFKVNGNDLASVLDLIAADLRVRVDLKNQRDIALDLV